MPQTSFPLTFRLRLQSPRFQLKRGPGDPPSRQKRAGNHGPHYKPGDPIRQTGIFEVIHDRGHRATHEAVMLGGDAFPLCDTCHDRVRFRLVRTAPYIFHDEDFEKGTE